MFIWEKGIYIFTNYHFSSLWPYLSKSYDEVGFEEKEKEEVATSPRGNPGFLGKNVFDSAGHICPTHNENYFLLLWELHEYFLPILGKGFSRLE